ncbi:C4-dicarboxylate ABC transporter permease [Betaproteobacteria bacterium]|nr:C4-dicarboxylate ABC transporter permease [Betaproteobacteria bacterium]
MGFLKNLDDWLAKLFTVAIVLITILAVFMRYILNDPLQWIEEMLIALYIWAIMLGAASAMKVRGHVSIDAFVVLLPRRAQRYVQHFNDIVGIVVLLAFGWLGWLLSMAAGDKITPILGFKYTYVDLAVPVGAFWMAFYLLLHLVGDIKKSVAGDD